MLRTHSEEVMHVVTDRHSHKTEGLYDMQTPAIALATETVDDVIRLMFGCFQHKDTLLV